MMSRILSMQCMVLLCLACVMTGCGYEPKSLSEEEKKGYELYKVHCRECHRLQSPKRHSADEWPLVLNKMQRIMKEKKRRVLDEKEKELILMFLQSQAVK